MSSDRYHVSAHAAIVDGGRLLLLRPTSMPDRWGLPGGHVEPGETVLEALKRECREELNVDIEVVRLAGVHHQREFGAHMALFTARIPDGAEIRLSGEHAEYAWVPVEALDSYVTVGGGIELLIEATHLEGSPTFRAL